MTNRTTVRAREARRLTAQEFWRDWAEWMLCYHHHVDVCVTYYHGPWGSHEGTVEERAFYALLIAEFIGTEPEEEWG